MPFNCFSTKASRRREDRGQGSMAGTMEPRNSSGDPPEISMRLPELKDIKPKSKSWERMSTDVLLLVVNNEEFLSCYAFLHNVFKSHIKELGKVYFGEIGDNKNKVHISLVRSSRGSNQVTGAQNVVRSAIHVLKPKAVLFVGSCAGFQKINLGDVVISRKLVTYGDRRIVDDKPEWNGRILDVSKKIWHVIKSADHGWLPPLNDPKALEIKVHCSAEILTGTELVNSPKECEALLRQFPEAIAIEPEGQGVYSAAYDRQMEWVVIKGISHYADSGEPETKEWRRFSSVMAASVVHHILKEPDIFADWPHYKESMSSQPNPACTIL